MACHPLLPCHARHAQRRAGIGHDGNRHQAGHYHQRTLFSASSAKALALGLPSPIVWTLAATVGGVLLLHYNIFGRRIYAAGGNPTAAFRHPDQARDDLGLCAGRRACWTCRAHPVGLYLHAARPDVVQGMELDVIASVILGGCSLFGGRGFILGTLLGSLIIGTLNNGLVLLGVSSPMQLVIKGAITAAAVAFTRLLCRRSREARQHRPPRNDDDFGGKARRNDHEGGHWPPRQRWRRVSPNGALAYASSALADAPASCVKGVDLATLGPTSIVGHGPHGEKAASPEVLKLSDAEAEKVKAGHFKVGISMQTVNLDWSQLQVQGITDTLKKYGVSVTGVASAEYQVDKQIADIENTIQQHPDGIISIPVDFTATAPTCQESSAGRHQVGFHGLPIPTGLKQPEEECRDDLG